MDLDLPPFFEHLLRAATVVLPVIGFSIAALLLLKIEKVRNSILPSEIVFYSMVGWTLGFFIAMSKGEAFATAFSSALAVASFFGMGIIRRKALSDVPERYEGIYISIGRHGLSHGFG